MKQLLIVSNRLPVTVKKADNGKLIYKGSVGGLATGLGSFYQSYNSLWLVWQRISPEHLTDIQKFDLGRTLMSKYDSYPVMLSENDVDNYYYGFCNKTIWPLFHCFNQYVIYKKELWDHYKRVNEIFRDAILNIAQPEDIIWIHDYQLMLLPQLIRKKLPDASIGFFSHIPFPPLEVFHLLPWRDEILKGLLASELIGFHTYGYAYNFLDSVRRLIGYDHSLGQINTGEGIVKVDAFPMGINYERFEKAPTEPKIIKEAKEIRKNIGDRKIVISIDRLDYTKGIAQRLQAFNLFLKMYPKYKEKVTLILLAVPSRTRLRRYQELKREVDELISQINGEHGTIGWTPISYLYRALPFEKLAALYDVSDVALITPLKDGMNLIAKEFLATKRNGKGVLILSEMAGASDELGEAITVNPNNCLEVAEALKTALSMPKREQEKSTRAMQKRLKRYNIGRWAEDFLDSLKGVKEFERHLTARTLTKTMREKIIKHYKKSEKRLILLDYDGTLVSFENEPEDARPDKELKDIIKRITSDSKNEVVIISGRDAGTLNECFDGLGVSLVGEHGALFKEKDEAWNTIEPISNKWKEKVRPIIKLYVDRTPGSLLEEKEFSIVWHYRKVEPELASIRAGQLKDSLIRLTANLDIGTMEGNQVIEVKNAGIDKSRPTQKWLAKEDWDFILAIGDDRTDEDTFSALPDDAYSIKVGWGPSESKFNIGTVKDVRKLLQRLGA